MKMGVTLETFQSFGSFDCLRDLLKMEVIAGVMALAVARSIWPETPSGPEAVGVLWVERYLYTSSWEQVTPVRVGLSLDGESRILS